MAETGKDVPVLVSGQAICPCNQGIGFGLHH
jgi:hypothetical protein